MVKDPDTVFMGLEYFCDEGDEMWNTPDQEFIDFAVGELENWELWSAAMSRTRC